MIKKIIKRLAVFVMVTIRGINKFFVSNYGYYFKKLILKDLIFSVTYRCNLRCKTCYYGNLMDGSAINERELSIDEIGKISRSLGRLDKLLISGGEPFLREDLDLICKLFYSQNRARYIQIPTNGFFTDKIYKKLSEILIACPKTIVNVALPMDGLEKTHDYIKGASGSYQQVLRTLDQIGTLKNRFLNLQISIFTVVNSRNIGEIKKIANFVNGNKLIDSHGMSPLRGHPYDPSLKPPTEDQWLEASNILLKSNDFAHSNMSWVSKIDTFFADATKKYLNRITGKILRGNKTPFRCQAGNLVGVLEPNGEVKLCELTGAIGNVRDNDYQFKKVWFSKKAMIQRKRNKECVCTHACFLWPSAVLHWPVVFFRTPFLNRVVDFIKKL